MKFKYTLLWDKKGKFNPRTEIINIDSLNSDDYILSLITHSKTFYENDLLLHLAVNGPQGGLFIDVGANIGNHSIFFGKFLAEHVVCIEPFHDLQPILKKNMDSNGITNYSIFHCGVGSKACYGEVIMPANAKNNMGMAQLVLKNENDENAIPVKTLDLIVRELDSNLPIQLIKVDVEGMELDVLRGAQFILQNHRPQLIIEAQTQTKKHEIDLFLGQYGYESIGQFCYTPTFHYIDKRVHKFTRGSFLYRLVKIFVNLRTRVRLHMSTLLRRN